MTDHPGDLHDTVLRTRATEARRTVPPAPVAPLVSSPPARLHSLRVAAEVLPLDLPVVVGRRPSAPRVQRGAPPRLVTVGAPGGSVSASHVDVRQEGGVVVVTDLRSTNGTRVQPPGRPGVQLRQGESVVVLAGTVVDLGDGVVLEILPPQRLTLKDGPQP